ncbi:MAG: response regulator [Ginsengibacter sp.]
MYKVLVVDDNRDILSVVELMLKMHDYTVKTVHRWEEITQSVSGFMPDLILLDISLSGADGRDICRAIKDSDDTKHIPVILFTAHHDLGSTFEECLADGLVTKPFSKAYLLETIRRKLS